MSNCLQCKKELIQTPGRRAKRFCDSTCRSAFWYGRNKRPTRKPKQEIDKVLPKGGSGKKEAKRELTPIEKIRLKKLGLL